MRFQNNIQEAIKSHFGSKKGMLKYFWYGSIYLIGGFHKHKIQNIGFKPKRLVFVCAGNICRSPLAEAVAVQSGINACSFGLNTDGKHSADPRAIEFAALKGYNLSRHVTRPISEYKENAGDLIIAMEPMHLKVLKNKGIEVPSILLGFSEEKGVQRNPYIHDPFNTCLNFFLKTEEKVVHLTIRLSENVKE